MNETEDDDLAPEYPTRLIHAGVRGKYAQRYREGSNVVVIDPDLRKAFPDARTVNEALRALLALRGKAAEESH